MLTGQETVFPRSAVARGIETAPVPVDYPWELVRPLALADGAVLRLRPIRPDDEPRLAELFHRLSRRTVYQRFFRAYDRLPEPWFTASPMSTTGRGSPWWPKTRDRRCAPSLATSGVRRPTPPRSPSWWRTAGRAAAWALCCSTPCWRQPRPGAGTGSRPISSPTTGGCCAW